ncbi:hypothetical protein [Tautonia sociabilis]|uniref:Secreted protein n=1 Tax=Tautonia sociabilis TaxID=2080755 RepID=A0A432MFH5_9BACT|nr:hypothetical protein [Tautonia sociabilis]RUL84684.1 hypothetical protein TsocGM_19885 [Tautonia sociabilis]
MPTRPRSDRRRPFLIALVAIIGMTCAAGAASACSTAIPEPGASCPMGDSSGGCCCCSPEPSAVVDRVTFGDPEALDHAPAPLRSPSSSCRSCVCPSNGPAAPASRQESRRSEGRPSSASFSSLSAILPPDLLDSDPTRPVPSVATGPPRVPIYLRTLHLLN